MRISIEPTEEFFKPLSDFVKDRPRCNLFLEVWKEYGSQYYNFQDGYYPIVLHVALPEDKAGETPHQENYLHSARVVSTLVAWFGTNNGFCFMEKLRETLTKKPQSLIPFYSGRAVALGLWAYENSLIRSSGGHGGRLLPRLIGNTVDGQIQDSTQLEVDTAENFMGWLGSDDGIELLALLKKASDNYFKERKFA